MRSPIDPTVAHASRGANQCTVHEWLDSLAAGACDQSTFLAQVDDLLRGSADAAWEVLSVLDQYYRRGKIKADLFHALKSHVQHQALGAGQDSDTSMQSPLAKDMSRASNMTMPVGASVPRPTLVPSPTPVTPLPMPAKAAENKLAAGAADAAAVRRWATYCAAGIESSACWARAAWARCLKPSIWIVSIYRRPAKNWRSKSCIPR
jgi:hypothetical protein